MNKIIIIWSITVLTLNCQWFIQNTNYEGKYEKVLFVDSLVGWIGANQGQNGFLLNTTNGGNDWDSASTYKNFVCFEFLDENVGFYGSNDYWSGWPMTHFIYKTIDGGNNWELCETGQYLIHEIEFVNNTTGWAVITSSPSGSIILKTTDGGVIWDTQFSNFDSRITSIKMLNSFSGFLSMSDPETVLKTIDGGENWIEVLFTNKSSTLGQFSAINSSTIYYCGSSVYVTRNGGDSWEENIFPTIEYHSISAINEKCWIIGDSWLSTRIIYSSNYGESWIPIKQIDQTVGSMDNIYFVNDQIGWVCGSNSLLLKTPNGGFNFLLQPRQPTLFRPINDTIITSSSTGFEWSEDDFAFYRFQLSFDSQFNELIIERYELGSVITESLASHNSYFWRVRGENIIDTSAWSEVGHFTTGEILEVKNENTFMSYNLYQNYPNPFNPSTKIKFEIPLSPLLLKGESEAGGFVTLKVYDILGNDIKTLVNQELSPGEYEVEFSSHSDEGQNLSSGIYFYQLIVGGPETSSGQRIIQTKKMVLLK